jgi:hypothetical protein
MKYGALKPHHIKLIKVEGAHTLFFHTESTTSVSVMTVQRGILCLMNFF